MVLEVLVQVEVLVVTLVALVVLFGPVSAAMAVADWVCLVAEEPIQAGVEVLVSLLVVVALLITAVEQVGLVEMAMDLLVVLVALLEAVEVLDS
jgi:hypothetical protein